MGNFQAPLIEQIPFLGGPKDGSVGWFAYPPPAEYRVPILVPPSRLGFEAWSEEREADTFNRIGLYRVKRWPGRERRLYYDYAGERSW